MGFRNLEDEDKEKLLINPPEHSLKKIWTVNESRWTVGEWTSRKMENGQSEDDLGRRLKEKWEWERERREQKKKKEFLENGKKGINK